MNPYLLEDQAKALTRLLENSNFTQEVIVIPLGVLCSFVILHFIISTIVNTKEDK